MNIFPHPSPVRHEDAPRPSDAKATPAPQAAAPAVRSVAKSERKEAIDGRLLKQRLPSTAALMAQFMKRCASSFEPGVREEIQEFLDHGEWGLAYEGIHAELESGRVELDASSLQILIQAADLMALPRPPSSR